MTSSISDQFIYIFIKSIEYVTMFIHFVTMFTHYVTIVKKLNLDFFKRNNKHYLFLIKHHHHKLQGIFK